MKFIFFASKLFHCFFESSKKHTPLSSNQIETRKAILINLLGTIAMTFSLKKTLRFPSFDQKTRHAKKYSHSLGLLLVNDNNKRIFVSMDQKMRPEICRAAEQKKSNFEESQVCDVPS